MSEREQFEAIFSQPPFEFKLDRYGEGDSWPSHYRSYSEQLAWEGWQTRATLAAAPAQSYDQAAMELCNVCGWKALILGDECLSCNRDKYTQKVNATPAQSDAHDRELAAYKVALKEAMDALNTLKTIATSACQISARGEFKDEYEL